MSAEMSKEEIKALFEVMNGHEVTEDIMAGEDGRKYNPEVQTEGVVRGFTQQIKAIYERGYRDGMADVENDIARNTDASDYQRGLDDAWEVTKKIIVTSEMGGLSGSALGEIFGTANYDDIVTENTASEALAKIRAWEEKKVKEDEIKIGDELKDTAGSGDRGIVTAIYDSGYRVMTHDGDTEVWAASTVRRTGRHFQRIAEILEQMQEERA